MKIALGIDTGGTYTDAVLLNHDTGSVLAGAKALTTRRNLAVGIRGAMAAVFANSPWTSADVALVGLSTTLATNTLAEGQRRVVPLFLIGYDRSLMTQCGLEAALPTADVVYVRGGHDGQGEEVAPLDEDTLTAAILARRDTAEAFAVSGYFAVSNPTHELRARTLIEALTGRPVTCGHELTSKLNAVRRATTVAFNAQLIAPLTELIGSVKQALAEQEIVAPLMVVKGDGSLVRAEWAMHRPVETILSGPAASVVGAWHLAGRRDGWVVDVGGTTTDIGALHDGWPILNDEGAMVSGWSTMVEAVDVHTAGLGGDSHVRFGAEGQLLIGPRRAVPLCLLASEHPEVVAELRKQAAEPPRPFGYSRSSCLDLGATEFMILGQRANGQLPQAYETLLSDLERGPLALFQMGKQRRVCELLRQQLETLETWGLARRAAFTPTDALHVLGRFTRWNSDAARLAATMLAGQAGLTVEAFCEQVVASVAQRVAKEIVSKVCEDAGMRPDWSGQPLADLLLRQALGDRGVVGLQCAISLPWPVIAIGAPVEAYLPQVAAHLHTELLIPTHAEVANAVGAVAGGIIQRRQTFISPLGEEHAYGVRLHLPDGIHDFGQLEVAVQHAQTVMLPLVEAQAVRAGADQVVTQMTRYDQIAHDTLGKEIYLGTELSFVATGRPRVSR
ncbi:MAG: hydantoinase/oxoprolinase N-terminal domain-containing protein [Syntrophales bacterium]